MRKLYVSLWVMLCFVKVYGLQSYLEYCFGSGNGQQPESNKHLESYWGQQNSYNHQPNVHIKNIASNEFKKIFAYSSNGDYQYECLGNLANFAYQDFRAYARTLSCYQDFMLLLSEKIHHDGGVRRATECVPGFRNEFSLWGKTKSEFHDFVHGEAARVKQEQERAKREQEEARQEQEKIRREQEAERIKKLQNTPRLSVHKTNELTQLLEWFKRSTNQERLSERIKALEQMRNSQAQCFDYSSQVLPINANDIYAGIFSHRYGTYLDCQLHKELMMTRATLSELERNFAYNHQVKIIAPMVHYFAAQAKQEKEATKVFEIADFCQHVTKVFALAKQWVRVLTKA